MTPSNLFEGDMTHISFGNVRLHWDTCVMTPATLFEGDMTHILFSNARHHPDMCVMTPSNFFEGEHDTHIIWKFKTSSGYVRHDSCNFVWRSLIIRRCKTSFGYVRVFLKESWRTYPSELRSHDSYILRICARHNSDMCKTSFRYVQDIIHKTSFTRHHSQDIIQIYASWLLQICLKETWRTYHSDMCKKSFGYMHLESFISHTHTHTHTNTHTHTHTHQWLYRQICVTTHVYLRNTSSIH